MILKQSHGKIYEISCFCRCPYRLGSTIRHQTEIGNCRKSATVKSAEYTINHGAATIPATCPVTSKLLLDSFLT